MFFPSCGRKRRIEDKTTLTQVVAEPDYGTSEDIAQGLRVNGLS
jgi:hypothetical protein